MQSLAFLWFDLQRTQQYLREKTFGPGPSSANSSNLNRSFDAGVPQRESVRQASPTERATQSTPNGRWTISPPRALAATKLIQLPEHR
jgi:hypothetical protein